MNKLFLLIRGECKRLIKYNILVISLIVTLIWITLLLFIKDDGFIKQLLPMIIMLDTTVMATIFIGALLYFEKDEQTNLSLLVTPTAHKQQIQAKLIVNVIHTIISVLVIVMSFWIIRGIKPHFVFLILAILIITSFHSLIGFLISYHSRDFMHLLLLVMGYTVMCTLPSILHSFNILFKGYGWLYIFTILPPQAAGISLEVAFGLNEIVLACIGLIYLSIASLLLYIFYIVPKYKHFSR